MDPSIGRFVSVDPFAGDPQAPVSLHQYLYANASPIINSDPSGNVTLSELNASINIQSELRRQKLNNVRTTINALRKPIWDIFWGKEPSIPGIPSHWFVYAKNILTRSGFRYDVGVDDIRGFSRSPYKYIGVYMGYVHVTPTLSAGNRVSSLEKVATLSTMQYTIWHAGVCSLIPGEKALYSVALSWLSPITVNCYTWTLQAVALAKIASKLPFLGGKI